MIGVSLTVLLLAKADLQIADFQRMYAIHITLALMTTLLCLPINTHPRQLVKSNGTV